MYNSILKVTDATFLLILMNAAINIKKFADGDISINSSFGFSIFGLVCCYVELVCTTAFLTFKYASLNEDKVKKRCGYAYEGLNLVKKGGMVLTYPLIYRLRFALLVYTILYLKDNSIV